MGSLDTLRHTPVEKKKDENQNPPLEQTRPNAEGAKGMPPAFGVPLDGLMKPPRNEGNELKWNHRVNHQSQALTAESPSDTDKIFGEVFAVDVMDEDSEEKAADQKTDPPNPVLIFKKIHIDR